MKKLLVAETTVTDTFIPYDYSNDKYLQAKDKGLLCQLFGLPIGWRFSLNGLAAICLEGAKSISSAIKRLVKLGYIVKRKVRDITGRFVYIYYCFSSTQNKYPKKILTSNGATISKEEIPDDVFQERETVIKCCKNERNEFEAKEPLDLIFTAPKPKKKPKPKTRSPKAKSKAKPKIKEKEEAATQQSSAKLKKKALFESDPEIEQEFSINITENDGTKNAEEEATTITLSSQAAKEEEELWNNISFQKPTSRCETNNEKTSEISENNAVFPKTTEKEEIKKNGLNKPFSPAPHLRYVDMRGAEKCGQYKELVDKENYKKIIDIFSAAKKCLALQNCIIKKTLNYLPYNDEVVENLHLLYPDLPISSLNCSLEKCMNFMREKKDFKTLNAVAKYINLWLCCDLDEKGIDIDDYF